MHFTTDLNEINCVFQMVEESEERLTDEQVEQLLQIIVNCQLVQPGLVPEQS
jgi:hypothetical protein